MNRVVALLGASLAVVGAVLSVLLDALGRETFRSDLPRWFDLSYALIVAGLIALAGSPFLKPRVSSRTGPRKASMYFTYLALVNAVAAALFALPVLDPALEFPILLTRGPGIYMVIGYVFFVIVGVLGNAAWAAILSVMERDPSLNEFASLPVVTQVLLTEAGVYGLAVFMFLGGYVGASLDYGGAGAGIVGISMEFAVVPSALSIFAIITGTLVGVLNLALAVGRGAHQRKS